MDAKSVAIEMTQEYYNAAWDDTGVNLKANMEIAPVRRLKREFIRNNIPKSARHIVALGCGVGYELSGLRVGVELEGYDVSATAIRLARNLYPGPVYKQKDVTQLESIGNADVALLIDVLEHLQEGEDYKLINRCTTAKTILIITDYSTVPGPQQATEPHTGHGGDLRTYGDELAEHMRRHGYVVKARYIQGYLTDILTRLKYSTSSKKIESARGGYSKPTLFQKLVAGMLYWIFKFDSYFALKGRILCLSCQRVS